MTTRTRDIGQGMAPDEYWILIEGHRYIVYRERGEYVALGTNSGMGCLSASTLPALRTRLRVAYHGCKHRKIREETRPFNHCLTPFNCNQRSHGNVMYVQHCEHCGAIRRLNANRGPMESTGWVLE